MLYQNSITVVITTYNSSAHIEKSIESVLKQTIKVNNIFIIDDNSSDIFILNEIVNKINKKSYVEIKLISNKLNKGPGFNRNHIWSKCKTEFIAFLDDDDFWYHDKLEQQLGIFKNNNNTILVAGKKKMLNQFYTYSIKNNSYRISFKSLLFKNFIPTSSVVLKTNIKDRFLNKYYAEDYYLWLSIVNKNHNCYFINSYICEELKDIKKEKLSSNTKEINQNVQLVLNKFYSENFINNIFISMAKIFYYLKRYKKKYLN